MSENCDSKVSNCSKVSVVLPIKTVNYAVQRSIDSIIGQTLADWELICIVDHTVNIKELQSSFKLMPDSSVKIVYTDTVNNSFASVIPGVLAATGKYITFLNCGDELITTACQSIWQQMQAMSVDLMLYATDVIPSTPEEEGNAKVFAEKIELKSIYSILNADQVLDGLCYDAFFSFVQNKAVCTVSCKEAIETLLAENVSFELGSFPLFMELLRSKERVAVNSKPLYRLYYSKETERYPLNIDADTMTQTNPSELFDCIERFFMRHNANASFFSVLSKQRVIVLDKLVESWVEDVSGTKAANDWTILLEQWGMRAVVASLTKQYWEDAKVIIEKLKTIYKKEDCESAVKHIGVLYYRMYNGGVERVTSNILPCWIDKGYKVSLVTEQEPTAEDYSIPGQVDRIILPKEADSLKNKYVDRFDAWQRIICENQIDTIVDEEHMSCLLPWDIISLKILGVNVVIWSHGLFSFTYRFISKEILNIHWAYYLADRIVVLSPVFTQYWGAYAPTCYIPNPLNIKPEKKEQASHGYNVLWVGRFGKEKRPLDALKAFSFIVKNIPDATLTMVGKGESPEINKEIYDYAKKLGISSKVIFAGFNIEVAPFYRKADLFLMTSEFEGYPLVLSEAKSFSLPVIMYNLPYLAQVIDHRGVVSVAQYDVEALAREAIRVLQDDDMLKKMEQASYEAACEQEGFDYAAAWDKLFFSIKKEVPQEWQVTEYQKMMIEQLIKDLFHGIEERQTRERYIVERQDSLVDGYGVGWYAAQCNALGGTIKELISSTRFRLGGIVTWFPRVIKTLLKKILAKRKGLEIG